MKNEQHRAEAQMLIRKPVGEVFNAFIDPAVTVNFWFTKSTGKLALHQQVTWEWEMYHVSTPVTATAIVPDRLITVEWGDPATTVDFKFQELKDGSTYVVVTNYGFRETGDDLIAIIRDSTGGFTTVLDGLKAYLEHGLRLNLIGDKFPKEVGAHGG
ncbi:SRPBCC family protein [Chitinophaga lutea]|nr:SRPBCC family protein [Chitinophaga lutea]